MALARCFVAEVAVYADRVSCVCWCMQAAAAANLQPVPGELAPSVADEPAQHAGLPSDAGEHLIAARKNSWQAANLWQQQLPGRLLVPCNALRVVVTEPADTRRRQLTTWRTWLLEKPEGCLLARCMMSTLVVAFSTRETLVCVPFCRTCAGRGWWYGLRTQPPLSQTTPHPSLMPSLSTSLSSASVTARYGRCFQQSLSPAHTVCSTAGGIPRTAV